MWGVGIVVMATLCLLPVSQAADNGPVIQLIAEVREPLTEARQSFRFVPAGKLTEGQEIFYTLRIHNNSDQPLAATQVVQAIPANTRYIAGSISAAGAMVDFSMDGIHFLPADQLPPASASAQKRQVTEYTHLRITLTNPLAPRTVLLARFRAEFR